ncbi:DUF4349 domain-containing protein [Cellulomonas sp. P5_C5]
MKPTTSHPAPTVRARTTRLVVAGVIALTATLSACSAGGSSDSGDTAADTQYESGTDQGAVGADEGGTDAGTQEGAADGSVAPAASTPDASRQVIQSGDVAMKVENLQSTVDAIVRITEDARGRVDDRSENAATETEVGTAALTIRLPAAEVTPTLIALRELGDVEAVELSAKDVTGAAQDLDARIHAMELSVGRMTNLLATATTHDEIIVAENALTEREAGLEQLRSQRAAIAEQVSLSTIHVAIVGPDLPPAVVPPAPVEPPTGPQSFVEGLATGWDALVAMVTSIAIVVGVLLPWLAFGGAIAALVVAAVRWSRRWRGPSTGQPLAAGVGTVFDPPAPPAGPPTAPPVDPHQPR